MSATVAADMPPGVQPIIEVVKELERPVEGSPIGDLLSAWQATTGGFQSQREVRVSATPGADWLRDLWTRATEENRESRWQVLPEDVLDAIEERGESFLPSDIGFLGYTAVSTEVPNVAAIAAIRLMAILAEENLVPMEAVLPKLRDALSHEEEQRRYYAVKAIWQAGAKAGVPALRRLLAGDPPEHLRALVQRALAVLE